MNNNRPEMLSEKMTELVARRFRLLGEPMRLRILQTLEQGERTVNDIADALAASQPNVSKHLQALCHGELISRRRDGLNIYYRVADPVVFRLCRLVCRSAEEQTRSQLAELNIVASGNKKSARRRREE